MSAALLQLMSTRREAMGLARSGPVAWGVTAQQSVYLQNHDQPTTSVSEPSTP